MYMNVIRSLCSLPATDLNFMADLQYLLPFMSATAFAVSINAIAALVLAPMATYWASFGSINLSVFLDA